MNNITIEIRSVYGNLKAYPMCTNSKLFAEIAGTKTLTQGTIQRAKRLGFDVVSLADADYKDVA